MEQNQSKEPKKPRIARKREIIYTTPYQNDRIQINEPLLHTIGSLADELGVKVFAVGGMVRDFFLKKPLKDIDISVIGDAISFASAFAAKVNSKPVVFERFKTAMVPVGTNKCEFVGTRKETYKPDSRNPTVSYGSLDDDLRRRDFTINTMAIALNQENFGTHIDLFNGKKDLDDCLLTTPLDPLTTFSDDPLRMMRAARFASQLDFFVDKKCIRAISQMSDRIKIISQERITEEFFKILSSIKPTKGLKILYDTGLLRIIFPELDELSGTDTVTEGAAEYGHKDVLRHTFQVLDKVAQQTDNVWLRLATLLHDIAKPKTKQFVQGTGWTFHGHEELGARMVEKLFRKFRLPMEHVPYVEKLVRLHQRPMALVDEGVSDSAIRRLAFQAGDALEDLFLLCRADITTKNPKLSSIYLNNYELVFKKVIDVQEKDSLREFQSPIRGDEIMAVCNLQPSKAIGIIKTNIEEAILDGLIPNEYDAAKAFFLENKDKWLDEIKDLGLI